MNQALWERSFIPEGPEAALCSVYPKRKYCMGRRRQPRRPVPADTSEGLARDLTRYKELTAPQIITSLLLLL